MTTPFPAQPPADSGAPVTASQPPATTPTDEPSGGEQRLDAELVRRGLARSRGQAVALVKSGAVSVSGAVVRRASVVVSAESPITVEADAEDPGFVSRAGFKLDGVLVALGEDGPSVAGVDCLDVGASTGGFTDVLLRRGAKSVVALDVGHGQLVEPLRSDPRVHVVERFNARELTTEVLPVAPGLVVADISFISLTMVLPAVVASVPTDAELLLMVKPQFEVGREHLGSGEWSATPRSTPVPSAGSSTRLWPWASGLARSSPARCPARTGTVSSSCGSRVPLSRCRCRMTRSDEPSASRSRPVRPSPG